jgi:hypothetical protein
VLAPVLQLELVGVQLVVGRWPLENVYGLLEVGFVG